MIVNLQSLITASMLAFSLQSPAAVAQPSSEGLFKAPATPAEIQVPAGNKVYLKGQALGSQNYMCQSSETGFFWKFIGPQATLFVTLQWPTGQMLQQIATHFLSPNPFENPNVPRPTWQSSTDTSTVWAKAIASSNDPQYVSSGSIPWLLLQVTGARPGPAGGSMLTQTTYIQRLNTSVGTAPTTGCSEAAQVGNTVYMWYTADYYFYRAEK
jgi:hypothetical protein